MAYEMLRKAVLIKTQAGILIFFFPHQYLLIKKPVWAYKVIIRFSFREK